MTNTKISIIGLGLIGGSIAKGLKKSEKNIQISAFDKPQVLDKALSDKTIDEKLFSLEEALKSEIIFLCLPVDKNIKILAELAPKLNGDQILTDVGSVKSPLHQKWNDLQSEGNFIGGHPMTGKEKSGYENSDPLLFQNAVYILTSEDQNIEIDKKLVSLIRSLGARISVMTPDMHDMIMAYVSHMPQLLSISLVNSVTENNNSINFLDFAAGGFRDMTRIASSDFNMWDSILKLNREHTVKAIGKLIEDISSMKENLSKNKFSEIHKAFVEARMKRDEIPKNQKGFLFPLFDIYVFVEDKPGVLHKITSVLYERSINIKDIELLKIREGTGGTFRLSFGSEEDAENAKKILQENEFTVS